MSLFKIKRLITSILLVGLFLPAYSQNKLDSLQRLKEVVVVAKPFQEVIPSQKLSGSQLESLNSHNVADALRYFAGVQIKDYGGMGGLKTVNVRNMGSQHVGVFYDGIQLGNAQNGTVDLGKFSLDDMEEISLYNGQKSDIFQPAKDFASGASVYLRTKRPRFTEGKKTNALARYKFGSISLANPSVRIERQLSSKVNMSLGSEYLYTPGKYKFRYKRLKRDNTIAYDTTAYRNDSDVRAFRIESGLFGRFEDGFWDAKIYYYDSERGLPGAIVGKIDTIEWKSAERQWDKTFFAQGSLNKDFSDKYKFQVKAKFAFDYTHFLSRDTVNFMDDPTTAKAQADGKYYQQEIYLSVVNMYEVLRGWDVSLSVDFQYNKLNASQKGVNTLFSYPQRYSTWGSAASSIDLGRFKAQASVIGVYVHEKVRHNTKAPDKKILTPALFLGYKPFDNYDFNLRAFVKRIFRMPTFNDLYYQQVGYALLKPEYTNQYNIGASYGKTFNRGIIQNISLQADAYYLNVTDKIIASPTGSMFRWMMSNIGKMKGKGVDITASAQARINKVYSNLNLTYSYSEMKDYQKPRLSSYGDQIPYTPWHSGSAIFGMQYNGWGLNYSFIYVGKRYNGAFNNIPENKVEPWYTHDLSVQKSLEIKGYKIKGAIEMNNALNQQYEVVLNYPMPGRNFKFVISVEL